MKRLIEMSQHHTYYIIEFRDKEDLLIGYGWEITTHSAILKSRKPIGSKNNCMISLKNHSKLFTGRFIDRQKIKNRKEILNEN